LKDKKKIIWHGNLEINYVAVKHIF
jgi:hypothetical protein